MQNRERNMRVTIAGVEWKNPITTASGTFSPKKSAKFYDPSKLGALTLKGVANLPWEGNKAPRIAEVYGGMLNAVGLQNPGVENFIKEKLPQLCALQTPIIVNVAGKTAEDYCQVVEALDASCVDMLEINVSCPNVKEGGMSFGQDAKTLEKLAGELRRLTKKPLIFKLSPNVTDITEMARAAESAGADALSLINTLLGMRIDVRQKAPILANVMGGLSGPAIKPVAVRMVYQVRRAVQLPIIGLGGIMTGEDAAEFLLAGADAVAVGTAALIDPVAPVRILEELETYMEEEGFSSVSELKEALK